MTPSEAAQQVADLLNDLGRQGVMASMADWPECRVVLGMGFAEDTVYRQVVWRDGSGWAVHEDGT